MRRLGLAATLVFVSFTVIASAATSEKVLNEPGVDEVDASASDDYLVGPRTARNDLGVTTAT